VLEELHRLQVEIIAWAQTKAEVAEG